MHDATDTLTLYCNAAGYLSGCITHRGIPGRERRVANIALPLHPCDVDGSLIKTYPLVESPTSSSDGIGSAGRHGIF